MITKITSFSSIPRFQRALYVFDIDDTVMGYKEFSHTYFTDKINEYKKLYDDHVAIDFAVSDWIEQVKKASPHHMDEEGYISIQNHIKSSESHHFFLTARNVNFKSITETHLEQLNISSTQVYYVSGQNKGKYLKTIIDKVGKFDKIIFIDDSEKNLIDMKNIFGKDVELYNFVKKFDLV
jgi:predicted phage tail protein